MASIRKCAREVLDTARDGIGFIALWKEGRSWNVSEFWLEGFDYEAGVARFFDYDMPEVKAILAADSKAVLLNSWYHNLGGMESVDVETLAQMLRWQYEEAQFWMSELEIQEVAS